MKLPSRSGLLALGIAGTGLTLGCDAPDGGRGATEIVVEDSAGVAVVRNPAGADWTLAPPPMVEEDLRIGVLEGAAHYQFGRVAAIDVDGRGRIYVLDAQAAAVRVFGADGRHLRTLGRPGEGPGELSPITSAVMVGKGDTVYVVDLGRQRIQAYAPGGADAGGQPLGPLALGFPAAWGRAPDGSVLTHMRAVPGPSTAGGAPPTDLVLRRSLGRPGVDTVMRLPASETVQVANGSVRVRMLAPENRWAMLSDGRMVHGRTDRYRLVLSGPDGEIESVATAAAAPQAITAGHEQAIREAAGRAIANFQVPGEAGEEALAQVGAMMRQVIEQMDFAEHYPVFANLLGGPGGTIWVQRLRPLDEVAGSKEVDMERLGQGGSDWDVFDRDGRLLGTLTLPDRFRPLRVTESHLYGIAQDELEVLYVVRLRIGF